jgi:hypothetical protein
MTYHTEVFDRVNARFGIESWHPFHDQRLAEYLIAVPADVKRRIWHDKRLLRSSGLHPPSVAWRRNNSSFSFALEHAMRSERVSQALSTLTIAKNGWVRHEQVTAAVNRFLGNKDADSRQSSALPWSLWMVFAVESWYKHAVLGERS